MGNNISGGGVPFNAAGQAAGNSARASSAKDKILNGGYNSPKPDTKFGKSQNEHYKNLEQSQYHDRFESDPKDPFLSPTKAEINKFLYAGKDGISKPPEESIMPKFHKEFTEKNKDKFDMGHQMETVGDGVYDKASADMLKNKI